MNVKRLLPVYRSNTLRLVACALFIHCGLLAFGNNEKPFFSPGPCPLWNCTWLTPAAQVQWGTVLVPENRMAKTAKEITLQVAVLRCQKPGKKAPVLFVLGGGPGGNTISFIHSWINHPLRDSFDIVLYDQRGTGFSKPRLCPFLSDSIVTILAENHHTADEIKRRVAAANQCRDTLLRNGIDISAYTSSESAADVDDIRRALGYERISILGVSYGTRLALTYIRDFPASLVSVVLDSTVPISGQYFENIPAALERAVDKLCASCAADPACNCKYPDLKKKIKETIAELDRAPLSVEWKDGGVKKRFVLNSQDFVLGLHQALYMPDMIPLVPAMIDQFGQRNKNLVAAFATVLSNRVNGFDYGVYYAVMCNETMPFNSVKRYAGRSATSPIFRDGIGFYTAEFKICDSWNKSIPDSIEHLPVISQVPTLVMAGEYDPITPPDNGRLVCKTLPNSYFVEFPLKSHALYHTRDGSKVLTDFLKHPSRQPATAFLFQRDPLHFITDTYITGGAFNAFESLSETRQIAASLMLFPPAAFLLYFLGWIIYMVMRKSKPQWKKLPSKENYLLTTGGLISLLGLIYFGGMIYSVNDGMHVNSFMLLFGLPGYSKGFILVSAIVLVLFTISLFKGFSIFKYKQLTKFWRVMYVILMMACLTYTALIINWKIY